MDNSQLDATLENVEHIMGNYMLYIWTWHERGHVCFT